MIDRESVLLKIRSAIADKEWLTERARHDIVWFEKWSCDWAIPMEELRKEIESLFLLLESSQEHCVNCGTNLPEGCGGLFLKDGEACLLNKESNGK